MPFFAHAFARAGIAHARAVAPAAHRSRAATHCVVNRVAPVTAEMTLKSYEERRPAGAERWRRRVIKACNIQMPVCEKPRKEAASANETDIRGVRDGRYATLRYGDAVVAGEPVTQKALGGGRLTDASAARNEGSRKHDGRGSRMNIVCPCVLFSKLGHTCSAIERRWS